MNLPTGLICTKQWGEHTIFSRKVSGTFSAQMGSCFFCAMPASLIIPKWRLRSQVYPRAGKGSAKMTVPDTPWCKAELWQRAPQEVLVKHWGLCDVLGACSHCRLSHLILLCLMPWVWSSWAKVLVFFIICLLKKHLSLKHYYFLKKATPRDRALSFTHRPAQHTTAESHRAQGNTRRRIIFSFWRNWLFFPYKEGIHPHFTLSH